MRSSRIKSKELKIKIPTERNALNADPAGIERRELRPCRSIARSADHLMQIGPNIELVSEEKLCAEFLKRPLPGGSCKRLKMWDQTCVLIVSVS